jgi:uncharacterized protein (DUF2225 family)
MLRGQTPASEEEIMAKNICPRCSQITLSFGSDNEIECPICETVFQSGDTTSNNSEHTPDINK